MRLSNFKNLNLLRMHAPSKLKAEGLDDEEVDSLKTLTPWFVAELELHWFSLAIFDDVLSVNNAVFH